jgi:hypothetical protein
LLKLIVFETIRCKLGGEEGNSSEALLYGWMVELID